MLIFLVTFYSCETGKKISAYNVNQKTEVLLALKENTLSDFPEFSLLNSNDDLWRVYNVLNSIRMPGINAPEVDFEKYTVLLINIDLEAKDYFDINIKTNFTRDNNLEIIYYPIGQSELTSIPNFNRVIKLVKIKKVSSISKIEEEIK